MDKAMDALYRELLREAHRYRVPMSVLTKLERRRKKNLSEAVIMLIRNIEIYSPEGEKESALLSMKRKRERFSQLQKETI